MRQVIDRSRGQGNSWFAVDGQLAQPSKGVSQSGWRRGAVGCPGEQTQGGIGPAGDRAPPHAGQVKVSPRILALKQVNDLMKGTYLCLPLSLTLDNASEMKKRVFSPFHYIGGRREENKPNLANLLDILERVIKMKLSPSLSRTALDSPCYRLCCGQLEREKKLLKPSPLSSCFCLIRVVEIPSGPYTKWTTKY